jgi:5'-AMP-activated protein kinase catalytic alpha subunit
MSMLGGRYEILRTLRKTLFGQVKLARDTQNIKECQVAVKLSRMTMVKLRSFSGGEPFLENPAEEIRIMTLLSAGGGHPHLVLLLDSMFDKTMGHQWSVMEFCSGGDFFDLVANNGRLDSNLAARYFGQLVSAVEHMHRRKIVHLDLSMENLLLSNTKNGIVKICDFGMARELKVGNELLSGKPGKIGYMAPEVYEGKAPFDGYAADMWNCGVMLFMMLTGTAPWREPSESDERYRIVMSGNIEKLLLSWDMQIPRIAIELLSHLLCLVEDRWSINQVLAHPWLVGL